MYPGSGMYPFDKKVPCGTSFRGPYRYDRADVEAFARQARLPYEGRTMDDICTDLGTEFPSPFPSAYKYPRRVPDMLPLSAPSTAQLRLLRARQAAPRVVVPPLLVRGRPCSTYGREWDRLTRDDVELLAAYYGVPFEHRAMDKVCRDLRALGV